MWIIISNCLISSFDAFDSSFKVDAANQAIDRQVVAEIWAALTLKVWEWTGTEQERNEPTRSIGPLIPLDSLLLNSGITCWSLVSSSLSPSRSRLPMCWKLLIALRLERKLAKVNSDIQRPQGRQFRLCVSWGLRFRSILWRCRSWFHYRLDKSSSA